MILSLWDNHTILYSISDQLHNQYIHLNHIYHNFNCILNNSIKQNHHNNDISISNQEDSFYHPCNSNSLAHHQHMLHIYNYRFNMLKHKFQNTLPNISTTYQFYLVSKINNLRNSKYMSNNQPNTISKINFYQGNSHLDNHIMECLIF